jgi:hypothetical protein
MVQASPYCFRPARRLPAGSGSALLCPEGDIHLSQVEAVPGLRDGPKELSQLGEPAGRAQRRDSDAPGDSSGWAPVLGNLS